MKTGADNRVLSVTNVGLFYTRRQGFRKRSRFWALQDVSFDLYAGETLGIIGRNGVGKSTLLKVLAGIIVPDTGKVTVYQPGLRISLLSLGAGFVPFLSGRENAILNGMILGATKREVVARLDDIMAFAELKDFSDEPVNTYSTGMRARLGFSVAYHLNPDVILLDEVMGVGDEAFRNKSTDAMKQRIKSDKTVVLVSHSIPILRELCDRIVWIEDGKSRLEGPGPEVLDAYLETITWPGKRPDWKGPTSRKKEAAAAASTASAAPRDTDGRSTG
ncbi:MAG: ABC transporter ATP-binding protein [Thermodesulfobacteriota bacterium]